MELRNGKGARPGDEAEREDSLALSAGATIGEYTLEYELGEGAMGTVYAAMHPILGKRVAVKVIGAELSRDAEAMARFRREARVVAQLESPHVVDVFGFGELPDGRAYFVMEYLVGEPLSVRLARGRVPLDEALDIIEQTARGLETAHAAGVVHRDLKPDNIFIEHQGAGQTVKLLDFGIVKVAKPDDGIAKTQAGVLVGTPLYIAPEQISHAGEVDQRADIYALGGVAFELVLGRVAFPYTTMVELVAAHLTAEPPSPRSILPEIPAVLDALLTAMLAKEPAKRPTLGHVQDVIETLRRSAFAPAKSNEAFSPGQGVGSAHRSHGRRIVAVAVVVGAVGIGALVFALTRGPGETPAPAEATHGVGVRVSPIEVPASAIAPTPVAPVSPPPLPRAPSSRPAVAVKSTPPPPLNTTRTQATDARVSSEQGGKGVPRASHVDPNGTIDPFAAKGSGR